MEITKYKKCNINETHDEGTEWMGEPTFYKQLPDDCPITHSTWMKNNILFYQTDDSLIKYKLESFEIRKLMKWQMGQDEYNENNKKHEEKHDLDPIHPNKDIKNQKIVDQINECFIDDKNGNPTLHQKSVDEFFEKFSKHLK